MKEIRFRTIWSRKMLNSVSLLVYSCFKDRIGKSFYISLWPATKNRYTTIILSAENYKEYPERPLRRRPHRISTVPRLCSAFGRTSSVWCIMNCWNRVKPLQEIDIERIWCVWAEHWKRNGHSTKRDTTKLSSSRQCSATCSKTSQDILVNAEMGDITLPTVLSRRGSSQKTHRFFEMVCNNCQKDGKNVVASDEQYFEYWICNHFLRVKL